MVHVVCAVIFNSRREIFCARRPPDKNLGGYWEFPGGKVEDGESEREALIRELEEELGVLVNPESPLAALVHTYPDFTIKLSPWVCTWNGDFTLTLHEHTEMKWLQKEELDTVKWCPADIALIQYLKDSL